MSMTQKMVLFWIISLVVLLALLILFKGILLPFVASMVLAYFLDPVVEWGEKKGLSRTFSVLMLVLLAVLSVLTFFAITVPILQHQITDFLADIPTYIQKFKTNIQPLWANAHEMFPNLDIENLKESMANYIGTALKMSGNLLKEVVSGGIALFNLLSLLIITPIVCFYLLRDWSKVTTFFKGVIPVYARQTVEEQVSEIDTILSGFIRGQATVCLALVFYYALALSLVGLDIGLLIGFLTGLLSFIPFVGCWTGFIISSLLGLAQFPNEWYLLWIVAIFLFGQVLEGYVLTPKLIGDKTQLHPAWIIFAVMAGAYLFGFLGVLVAVPVAAVIGVLTRFSLTRYKASEFYVHKVEPSCGNSEQAKAINKSKKPAKAKAVHK